MKRIELVELKIKGFRSFLEESSIRFNTSGLYCVHGKDLRTGGSNGSGKSSIFEAIYWVLGLNTLPTTELKNYHADSMSCSLEFRSNNCLWYIHRTASKLNIMIDGVIQPGMKAALDSQLFDEIGDSNIFEALSYRRQSDQGIFFYTSDSDLKKFLTRCLPEIDKLDSVSQVAQEKANKLNLDLESKKVILATLESQLKIIPNVDDEIKAKQAIVHTLESAQTVPEVKDYWDAITVTRLEGLITSTTQASSDPSLLELTAEEKTQLITLEVQSEQLSIQLKKIGTVEDLKASFLAQKSQLNIAIKEVAAQELILERKKVELSSLLNGFEKISAELQHCKDSKCPTCLRTWEEALNKANELERSRKQVMIEMMNIDDQLKQLDTIRQRKKTLTDELSILNDNERKILMDRNVFVSEIEKLDRDKLSLEQRPKLRYQLSVQELALKIEKYRSELKSIKQSAEMEMRKDKDDRSTRLLNARYQLKDLLAIRDGNAAINNQIEQVMVAIKAITADKYLEEMVAKTLGRKGVLGLIFSDILSETESEANRMLSEIPNTSDISVSISSVTENKSGTLKNEIKATITKSGNEISFKSLSGGQKASLSLCTDLALMACIRRRTNINSGWLALDESMDGMDVASKEAAIGVLKSVCGDAMILLIDHATEIKEMFDGIIQVEYDGKTSRIS